MAKIETVTSNFTVNFSIAGDGLLKAEVDNRDPKDGGTNLSTSFKPGDDVMWLLFKTPDVIVEDMMSSHGTLSLQSSGVTDYLVEDYISVAGDTSASLSYPFAASWSAEWVGDGGIQPNIKPPSAGDSEITFEPLNSDAYKQYGAVGVIKVSYLASYDLYKLAHTPFPGLKEYPIVVFVVGTKNNDVV